MKTKKWITILTAVLLLASVAGCAASGETGPDTPAATVNSTAPLSAADAQKLALEHAQLTADKVTSLRTEYDLDDGVPEYEVDFRQGDYEYDYTIHAETGKVLHWDKEFDPVDPKPAEPQTPTTAPVKPEEPAPEKLTADDAKKIALDHAGLTADKVTGLRTEYDLDDGVPEYEVDFRQGDYEYDYTIHAETGKVLHWNKEFDPVDPKPTKPAEPQTPTTAPVKPEEPAPEKLTADDAKKIALDHAGLTADKVTGLRAKYDVDDGVPTYEVEFYADGWEYDYEIHAEIGKILEWDKDD